MCLCCVCVLACVAMGCCVVVTVQKKEKIDVCNFKKSPAREFISITVFINSKIFNLHQITNFTVLIYTKTIKSEPRISVIIFEGMVFFAALKIVVLVAVLLVDCE